MRDMRWLSLAKNMATWKGNKGRACILTVNDKLVATYQDPHRYAEGVEHVFVNGGHVLANGEPTGRVSGRVLRRGVAADADDLARTR